MSCRVGDQSHLLDQERSSRIHTLDSLSSMADCHAARKWCTQACFLRDEQNTREIQKLRDSYVALKLETDKEIAFLKQQLATAQSSSLSASSKTSSVAIIDSFAPSCPVQSSFQGLTASAHTIIPTMYSITDNGVKPSGRIDRLGSIKSAQVLAALRPSPVPATGGIGVARRVLAALADPMMTIQPYLRSLQFAADLIKLSAQLTVLPDHWLVNDPAFEAALVKLQEGGRLTTAEKTACAGFVVATTAAASSGGGRAGNSERGPSFAEEALKRRRICSRQAEVYLDTSFVPPTSNLCERLFSLSKLVFSEQRRRMNPVTLEMLIFLNANRVLWK